MRARYLMAAALLLLTAAACGDASGGAAAPAPPVSALPADPPSVDERFGPDIPGELRVSSPKDARGIAPCDLLTIDQLVALELDPQSARRDEARNGPGCAWEYDDGSTFATVGLGLRADGAKLPDIYRLRSTFAEVEIMQIAGHPVLRADDRPIGECTLNVAAADDQLLIINGYLDDRELPDPCAMAREMAELILSNLPPTS